jgi:uncharacterized protein YvpB
MSNYLVAKNQDLSIFGKKSSGRLNAINLTELSEALKKNKGKVLDVSGIDFSDIKKSTIPHLANTLKYRLIDMDKTFSKENLKAKTVESEKVVKIVLI